MKNYIFTLILSIGLFILRGSIIAQTLPEISNPPRLVNDFAGILSSEEKAALESKLVAFDDSTTNQISVVTVNSLDGDDISDYTIKLFQKWKIGESGKNNGILVLISKPDKKVWITTGKGLEGGVTDALTKRFIDLDMLPNFKQGHFYAGLDLATTHLMKLAKGEFHDIRPQSSSDQGKGGLSFIPLMVIFLIILFFITRGGGGNQVIGGSGFPFWFFLGSLMNSGRGDSWGGNSGGGFGGGGGGGFGGFGGGDTGGGGAGGSW